jgi:hypothetical protein
MTVNVSRASPSGKAPVFGTGIRGFESLRPSHKYFDLCESRGLFYFDILNIMSEKLDETFWGPEPSDEEVAVAEQGMAVRAEKWKVNPPVKPENYHEKYQPHPDDPGFGYSIP